jgi:hypothetical protein
MTPTTGQLPRGSTICDATIPAGAGAAAGNATLASEADSGSIDAGLRLFRGSSGCTYLLWEVSTEA